MVESPIGVLLDDGGVFVRDHGNPCPVGVSNEPAHKYDAVTIARCALPASAVRHPALQAGGQNRASDHVWQREMAQSRMKTIDLDA
jgi:hypothetical protein